MPKENNEGTSPQSQENANQENANEVEAPRAKTPLELVREREAKMRGHTSAPGHSSNERQTASAANSYKRRQHQRRAG